MQFLETTTAVSELEDFGYEDGKYPIRVQTFESVSEALALIGKIKEEDVMVEASEGALSAVLGVINAAQAQGGKQGGKETIRAAVNGELKEGQDRQEAVDAAVAAHVKRAEGYVIGAPRGSTGGVTKTRAGNVGKALLEKLGPEALQALAAEHGLDLADLG